MNLTSMSTLLSPFPLPPTHLLPVNWSFHGSAIAHTILPSPQRAMFVATTTLDAPQGRNSDVPDATIALLFAAP